MSALGDFLRAARRDAGLLQRDLANELNVTQTTVSQWESGRNMPNNDMIEKLADYFNVDVNTLFGYPSESELAFKRGLEGLKLDKYKRLSPEDKELVAEQFNSLVARLGEKK